MAAAEALRPLEAGPLFYEPNQIFIDSTKLPLDPEMPFNSRLVDTALGDLGLMGAEVELVGTSSHSVSVITIAAIGRSYMLGERPDGSKLIPLEEIFPPEETEPDEIKTSRTWLDCPYVTFYSSSKQRTGHYEYDQIAYRHLGLAPVLDKLRKPIGWDMSPIWYLRWPIAEAVTDQAAP